MGKVWYVKVEKKEYQIKLNSSKILVNEETEKRMRWEVNL
ncbi:Uncharacterised protein [Lacrimispora sphenoides]|uniref:Uncharacterized protein n=1 Tax=Lacrimispora sphenoides JCM 1415 TaxID=1297793 RepID=A0ABY1C6U4_9FIRM|nr:hypothetical protein SAMN02745906_1604 [[Clostridium] sphenoides JCM 1415]SUY50964.1 Uncharacterised protein [Lacrimispora sphenoides]